MQKCWEFESRVSLIEIVCRSKERKMPILKTKLRKVGWKWNKVATADETVVLDLRHCQLSTLNYRSEMTAEMSIFTLHETNIS